MNMTFPFIFIHQQHTVRLRRQSARWDIHWNTRTISCGLTILSSSIDYDNLFFDLNVFVRLPNGRSFGFECLNASLHVRQFLFCATRFLLHGILYKLNRDNGDCTAWSQTGGQIAKQFSAAIECAAKMHSSSFSCYGFMFHLIFKPKCPRSCVQWLTMKISQEITSMHNRHEVMVAHVGYPGCLSIKMTLSTAILELGLASEVYSLIPWSTHLSAYNVNQVHTEMLLAFLTAMGFMLLWQDDPFDAHFIFLYHTCYAYLPLS